MHPRVARYLASAESVTETMPVVSTSKRVLMGTLKQPNKHISNLERVNQCVKEPYLKLVSAIFYQIFIFSSNNRPSKTMKNVFYFIKKALFVLEIFKFLHFFPFHNFQTQKDKWKWNNL